MSATDIRKINSRITAIEEQAQTLNQTISSLISTVEAHKNDAKTSHDNFVTEVNNALKTIPSSLNDSLTTSMDVVKARVLEELKAYIDAKIAEVVASSTEHQDT